MSLCIYVVIATMLASIVLYGCCQSWTATLAERLICNFLFAVNDSRRTICQQKSVSCTSALQQRVSVGLPFEQYLVTLVYSVTYVVLRIFYIHANPLESRGNYIVPHQIIWSWYTGRWWVDCYIWYSEEGTGRGRSPGPLLCGFNVGGY